MNYSYKVNYDERVLTIVLGEPALFKIIFKHQNVSPFGLLSDFFLLSALSLHICLCSPCRYTVTLLHLFPHLWSVISHFLSFSFRSLVMPSFCSLEQITVMHRHHLYALKKKSFRRAGRVRESN